MELSFGDVLKKIRLSKDMSQEDFAALLGTTKQVISRYETNQRTPKITVAKEYADILGIPLPVLLGEAKPLPDNIIPMPKTYKVPLIGTIACGQPILAVEEADESIEVPEWIHADFALRCKGDSMINARIFDGDIVYIRSQPEVENGEIAAVRIGDEATLKRVYYNRGRIILRAANPTFPDMEYEGYELDENAIIGKAVGFTSKI